MTRPALWLAVRELGARRLRVATAAAVVAAIAAAVTATELVARAREDAVAERIDAIGPALTIVPSATPPGALARYEIAGALPAGTEARVREALGSDLRASERRLVLHRDLAGIRVPVVGVERGPEAGAAEIGSELARRLRDASSVSIGGEELRVSRVLPSTGSVEDLALFVPMAAARALAGAGAVNELRLFLRAGVAPREAEARLARAALEAAVVRSDRGDVADRDTHGALARHRGVAYAVMAAVAALCLLIAAHLDASERRVELATLVAIGAARTTVLGALLARSAVVAGAGAAAGALAGAALAAGQDPAVAAAAARSWALAATTVAAGLCVGVLAGLPTALATVARDPVRELQEG